MNALLTQNFHNYLKALKAGDLAILKGSLVNAKFTRICQEGDFQIIDESDSKFQEKKSLIRTDSLMVNIGAEEDIKEISEAYSYYKRSKFISVSRLSDLKSDEFSECLRNKKYVTFVVNGSNMSDSDLQEMDILTDTMCSDLTAYGVISYENRIDLSFQIFKLIAYPKMKHCSNYLIAHNSGMKESKHFDFFDATVGKFPYGNNMDIFSFQGHGREEHNFIYNGYICANNFPAKEENKIGYIPHWKRHPEYYSGKKDFVYANEIRCKVALINSCTSFTLGRGAYSLGDSISEGFKNGYAAVTIGNNLIRDGNSIENIFFEQLFTSGCTVGEAVKKLNLMADVYQFDARTYHIVGDPEFTLYTRKPEKIQRAVQDNLDRINLLVKARREIEKNFLIINSLSNLRWYGITARKISNYIYNFREQNISALRSVNIQNIHKLDMRVLKENLFQLRRRKKSIFVRVASELVKETNAGNYQFSEYYHEDAKMYDHMHLNKKNVRTVGKNYIKSALKLFRQNY